MRPFHDLRHTAITNDAAAGSSPIAVMTKAGHTDMRTTKRYLHLAGVVLREEAERSSSATGSRRFLPIRIPDPPPRTVKSWLVLSGRVAR